MVLIYKTYGRLVYPSKNQGDFLVLITNMSILIHYCLKSIMNLLFIA